MSEKNDRCIFASEDDCPLDSIEISCESCMENNYGATIKLAIEDYTQMGDNFTSIFEMFESLISNKEKVLELNAPVDNIQALARLVNALLGMSEETDLHKLVYRRLIFLFFRFMIEEFESVEYSDPESVH